MLTEAAASPESCPGLQFLVLDKLLKAVTPGGLFLLRTRHLPRLVEGLQAVDPLPELAGGCTRLPAGVLEVPSTPIAGLQNVEQDYLQLALQACEYVSTRPKARNDLLNDWLKQSGRAPDFQAALLGARAGLAWQHQPAGDLGVLYQRVAESVRAARLPPEPALSPASWNEARVAALIGAAGCLNH